MDSSEHKSAQQVRKQPKHAKDKTHLDFWSGRIFKPTFTRGGKQHLSAHYAVEIQFQGKRHKWSLGSGNKDAAAYRARELYLFLKANGWDKTLAKYRPQPGAETSDITVGQFIERVEAVAEVSGTTLRGYVSALRKIVSDGPACGAQKSICLSGAVFSGMRTQYEFRRPNSLTLRAKRA
jgi:hypothetical protein